MKTYIYLLLLLTISTLGMSQNRSQYKTLLLGQWSANYDQTVALMQGRQLEQYDSLNTVFQQKLAAGISGQSFTFFEGKRFEATAANGDVYPGKWSLHNRKKRLRLTYDSGAKIENTIVRLNDTTLIIQIAPDGSNQLFHFLHLDLISR